MGSTRGWQDNVQNRKRLETTHSLCKVYLWKEQEAEHEIIMNVAKMFNLSTISETVTPFEKAQAEHQSKSKKK